MPSTKGSAVSLETEKDNLLSIDVVARRLNHCRKSIENLISRKELRVVRIGRRVLVRPRDLELFIEKKTVKGNNR